MRRLLLGIVAVMLIAGCGGRKSSLLLERPARGPLGDVRSIGQARDWKLQPTYASEEHSGVEVTINQASMDYLKNFFDNEDLFGPYAGRMPYYPEHLVFYVKISNNSGEKIHISPDQFKLIDDRGNQLTTIGVDHVTAFANYRTPVGSSVRSVAESARPGYFGFSVPVGSVLTQKAQWRFALLKQSALQPGYMYPGVEQDGLIAFWSPSQEARTLRLVIANITSGFNAMEEPSASHDFVFSFETASKEVVEPSAETAHKK